MSLRTAIFMGCARSAALLAAAERGLPIHEYAPRRVKQAVVGRGGAQKNQVNSWLARSSTASPVEVPPTRPTRWRSA